MIVALLGNKGHGKDTFAGLLVHHLGFSAIAFGDALYTETARRHGVSVEFLRERATKESPSERLGGLSPRQALQSLGMAAREADPEVWIHPVRRFIGKQSGHGGVVITDVRLPNEARFAQSVGAVFARVRRPGLPPSGDAHITETALAAFPCDIEIVNREQDPDGMLAQWLEFARQRDLPIDEPRSARL